VCVEQFLETNLVELGDGPLGEGGRGNGVV